MTFAPSDPDGRARRVPPLQTGDRLSRPEFERRYAAMPDLKKAELIEGTVFVPSPVRARDHGTPHFLLGGWAVAYVAATPGVEGASDTTVRLDLDNEPQPDLLLRILPEAGGQTRDADGYVEGPPEWVAEVAATTASHDLHAKLHVYRRAGVREYVVWRVLDAAVDAFVLEGGEFTSLAPDESGVLRSRAFPGLWLDVPALLRGDAAALLARGAEGIASDEHVRFAASLGRR